MFCGSHSAKQAEAKVTAGEASVSNRTKKALRSAVRTTRGEREREREREREIGTHAHTQKHAHTQTDERLSRARTSSLWRQIEVGLFPGAT